MVKKNSLAYKRLVKLFGQLAENPYGIGKWMHSEYTGVREMHIGHFMVKYVIDDKNGTVTVVDYGHHT